VLSSLRPAGILSCLILCVFSGRLQAAPDNQVAVPSRKALLSLITGWSIQLQDLDPVSAAGSAQALLVTDYSKDGTAGRALTVAEVDHLKIRPDGGRRLVISYLSIGEAEEYRYYWNRNWTKRACDEVQSAASPGNAATADGDPSWLHCENKDWRGNFIVRFWQPDWQRLIFGGPESYLDRIIAAGFDGVSLDRVDVYNFWERQRATAGEDMVQFIAKLSAYAKRLDPNFLIVLHNAEELLDRSPLKRSIDAVVKEELLYGETERQAANDPAGVATSVMRLKKAQRDGIKILAVEYLDDQAKIEFARRTHHQLQFTATFGHRSLDQLQR
jgi:cysteinyl-tRNA synthetase, unknown class